MNNLVLIEFSALPLLLTLIVSTVSRKLNKGRANILLFWVLVLAFLSSLADTVANFFVPPLNDLQYYIVKWNNYLYFVTRNGLNCVYFFYIIAVTRTWHKIKAWWIRLLLVAPYAGIVIMLILNPTTSIVFSVTRQNGYQRGSMILVVYLLAAYYLVVGIAYLSAYRKLLTFSEWSSLFSLYLLNALGVAIQLIFPFLLVECYFTSITLLFVVLYVQKPEKQIDVNTGLPAFFAFRDAMSKIESNGQKVQVVIACFDNADELINYLGDKTFRAYIHDVERSVTAYTKKERLLAELYFEPPGHFYVILNDTSYNPVQGIQEIRDLVTKRNSAMTDSGLQVNLKIVSVRFPDEIGSCADLIHFAHNFVRFTGDRILYHTEQIVGKREYRIEIRFDEILKRAVIDGKLSVAFRPVWSAVKKGPVFAEAVAKIDDADFGVIDDDTLREVALARGASALFEEFVLEQVFVRLKQERISQAGLSYVVVKLSGALGMQKSFADMVWNFRSRYDVYPGQICFAVKAADTERAGENFLDNIKQLVRLGYRIAIDDYGSGLANTEFLSEYEISSVRLDRSMLTENMTTAGRAVLRGTIAMLRSIPVDVVVRGVDDEETRDMLAGMGCELMQGGLFDKTAGDAMSL
ncbi:MAG: EAL domain-containing protein [Lachnospiraceae bacterium]|nr:EAL domain-containing protein [Lachnospiraceae bacterium]